MCVGWGEGERGGAGGHSKIGGEGGCIPPEPLGLGMSTFRFFCERTFRFFLSLRKKMYFVSFSFLNSKKSKDSFIVY